MIKKNKNKNMTEREKRIKEFQVGSEKNCS